MSPKNSLLFLQLKRGAKPRRLEHSVEPTSRGVKIATAEATLYVECHETGRARLMGQPDPESGVLKDSFLMVLWSPEDITVEASMDTSVFRKDMKKERFLIVSGRSNATITVSSNGQQRRFRVSKEGWVTTR